MTATKDDDESAIAVERVTEWSDRFFLQSGAGKLLWREKVSACCRRPIPTARDVDILRHKRMDRATVRRTVRCKSVWMCPVCAGIISEARRRELKVMILTQGYIFMMATYTLRHSIYEKLDDVLDRFQKAHRAFKSGKGWQMIQSSVDWVGSVKALEVTYGDNGWHVHAHEIICIRGGVNPYDKLKLEGRMSTRWMNVLQRIGGSGIGQYAFNLVDADNYVSEYVSKWGKLPTPENLPNTWGVDAELTKATVKRSRSAHGRSPMQLLWDYAMVDDLPSGKLFIEYAKAFKGRKQLHWSEGLRAEFGLVELDDDGIVEADDASDDYQILATVSLRLWRKILKSGNRDPLLRVASLFPDAFDEFLKEIDEYVKD